MRKFFRATYYLAGIVLFLAVIVTGLTQTKTFRTYLHRVLTDIVATQLHGTVQMGSLEGNLFTGVRVDSVRLFESGQPILDADKLEVRYDLLGVLVNQITLYSVKIERPRIYVTRSPNGSWNIDRLIPASSSTDSIPASTVVDFKRVQLVNAELVLVDSVKLLNPDLSKPSVHAERSLLEYPTLTLRNINLSASVRLAPRRVTVAVGHLSFILDEPALVLTRLSGEFSLNPSEVSLKRLTIETNASQLQLNAALKNVDFGIIHHVAELETAPVTLTLDASRLSFSELRQLFPTTLGFLDREIQVHLKAGGTVGRLTVEDLVLRTPQSFFRAEGTVWSLHRPEALEMDMVCLENKIDFDEMRRYVPALSLPDMHTVGELTYNMRFTGKPTAFKVRFEGTSRAGNAEFDATATIREGVLSYDLTARTHKLDIGTIVNDEALHSSLFSTVTLKGTGTDLLHMTATAQATIDSSELFGIPLNTSTLNVDVAEGTLTTHLQLRAGETSVGVRGTARFQHNAVPSYRLEGTVEALNLASVLKRRQYESTLSFTATLEGNGLSVRDMQSTLTLNIAPSSFAGRHFAGGWARAELNAAQPEKQEFHLSSSVADLDIEGQFRLDSFLATLETVGKVFAEGITRRIYSLSSLRHSAERRVSSVFRSSGTAVPDPLHVRLTLTVKDLYPFGVFFGQSLNGKGTATAEVAGSLDNLRLSGSTTVESFQYADSSVSLNLAGSTLHYRIENLSRTNLLDSLRAALSLTAEALRINDALLAQPEAQMSLRGSEAEYEFRAVVDSSLGVQFSGRLHDDGGFIACQLDKLQLDLPSYTFLNVEPVLFTLGRDGVRVEKFALQHEAEEVRLAGYFNPENDSDFQVEVSNFLLSNLRLFSQQRRFLREVQELGGVVDAQLRLRGGLASPDLTLNLTAHGVRYGTTVFGRLHVRAAYADRLLNLFGELRSTPSELVQPADLLIAGSLPYDFSFRQKSEQKLQGEMDVTIRSNGFRLELIDPFIAELSNISGTLACDMNIRGTIDEPRYEGSLSLQSARFLLRPIGITYILNGRFVPAGERIALADVQLRNVPQDRPEGLMNVSGSLTLRGLKITAFDLLANGQLLVMKESARQAGQTIYGDLVAASGSNGIRWHGTLQRSVISGEVLIKSANLTLPPTREQLVPTSREVTITVVNDTLPMLQSSSSGAVNPDLSAESKTLALSSEVPLADAKNNQQPSVLGEDDSRSFLERIVYDLDVETQGPTHVRFIFNPYTGEELFAELKGRMAFTKDGDQMRLAGEVEVGERSYYNFLKRFQASGKLQFTGDPLNPELTIVARYESLYKTTDTTRINSESSTPPAAVSSPRTLPSRVIVLLYITGTRKEPRPKFEIELVDREGNHEKRTTGDVESDAIAFILTGSFRDELTQQERSALLGSNLLYGLTSSVLSGPISDFIRKEFGFISSIDVIYYGGNVQSSTDVRLTGEVGEAVIRFGGRVFSDISNANWSVQLPMSSVLGSEKWRNLIIEAERRVEGVEAYEQRRESNGVRLVYRITF